MILPLQVADGRFAARCALLGDPDQEILGVVDSGATITCVDARTCDRADLRFAGYSGRVRCVHRNHREVVKSYFGSINIWGRTEHTTVYELDMGPESERGWVNAILGWDVLGGFRVTMDGPSGTGSMEQRPRARS